MNDCSSLAEPILAPMYHRDNVAAGERTFCLSRGDFEAFVCEYGERLSAVARGFFRSAEDAADAVQDALLSAYTARHTFQGQSTVYTWLYRIVVNACLMRVRAERARRNRSFHTSRSICRNPLELADATAVAPSRLLEREEARLALRAHIDQLPADFRMVLLMRDIEELNTSETAQRLKLSQEAVKTRVFRARQALRLLLQSSNR